jgi:hypothetical protein
MMFRLQLGRLAGAEQVAQPAARVDTAGVYPFNM